MKRKPFKKHCFEARPRESERFRTCECGVVFERLTRNQRNCPECMASGYASQRLHYHMEKMLCCLKAEADRSGNARVYSSETHSQEFLRGLIPA